MGTIVVGVDGSGGGAAALDFAAAEAALRKARLRIVVAWEVPVTVYGAGFAPPVDPATVDGFRVNAERVAKDASTAAKKLQPGVDVQAVAVAGPSADVLLEQGANAELIVVGRRGHGGFKRLLLGSVSQQVVHYAERPVVVVNQPATDS